MTLAIWQAQIVDEAGNIQPNASVRVQREVAGAPLATIYSDRDGATPIGNPMTADSEGFAAFHAAGGAYRITATKGAFSRVWRYVGIGLAQEQDSPPVGASWLFASETADADPGAGLFRLNNATPASATAIYIDAQDKDGIAQAGWLDTLDDGGDASERGILTLRSTDNAAVLVARVTGSLTPDGSPPGYYAIPVTVLSASDAATFTAGAAFGFVFVRSGADGADGIFDGAEAQVAAAPGDLIPIQDASDSNNPKRVAASTVGAGKQTIWVPASAMKSRAGTPELISISNEWDAWALDPNSNEDLAFSVAMPKGWNLGAINYRAVWSHPATTTNFDFTFGLLAKLYSDGDTINTSGYTALTFATDTGGTTNGFFRSGEVATSPLAGAAEGDTISFIFRRNATAGSDTLAVDAYVIGVELYYTTNANTDD